METLCILGCTISMVIFLKDFFSVSVVLLPSSSDVYSPCNYWQFSYGASNIFPAYTICKVSSVLELLLQSAMISRYDIYVGNLPRQITILGTSSGLSHSIHTLCPQTLIKGYSQQVQIQSFCFHTYTLLVECRHNCKKLNLDQAFERKNIRTSGFLTNDDNLVCLQVFLQDIFL